jgi:hypothetical protein
VADTMGIVSTDHRDGTTKLPVGPACLGSQGWWCLAPRGLEKKRDLPNIHVAVWCESRGVWRVWPVCRSADGSRRGRAAFSPHHGPPSPRPRAPQGPVAVTNPRIAARVVRLRAHGVHWPFPVTRHISTTQQHWGNATARGTPRLRSRYRHRTACASTPERRRQRCAPTPWGYYLTTPARKQQEQPHVALHACAPSGKAEGAASLGSPTHASIERLSGAAPAALYTMSMASS